MKRLLFVFSARRRPARHCWLRRLLAGPTAPTSYPPMNIPVIVPAVRGRVWVYGTSLSMSDISIYQAVQRGKGLQALPVGSDVIVCMGWLGSVYGQVSNVPNVVATTIDITGPYGYHSHFDPADTAPYWTGVHAWDEWWTEWLGGPPPELRQSGLPGRRVLEPPVRARRCVPGVRVCTTSRSARSSCCPAST